MGDLHSRVAPRGNGKPQKSNPREEERGITCSSFGGSLKYPRSGPDPTPTSLLGFEIQTRPGG